jgi:hypothetical protein
METNTLSLARKIAGKLAAENVSPSDESASLLALSNCVCDQMCQEFYLANRDMVMLEWSEMAENYTTRQET